MTGARLSTAPHDAPPFRASCRMIYPSGGRPCKTPGIRSASATSSSPETSPAHSTAHGTRAPVLATSAKAKHVLGARASSLQRSRKSRNAPSSSRYSAQPPTRCAEAESLYVCVPRTRKLWPASAAPVSKCSATTTPTPSKTCGESAPDRQMSSGGPREQHRRTVIGTSKPRAPPLMTMRGAGERSLLGFQPVERPNARHSPRPDAQARCSRSLGATIGSWRPW